ncbi:hypothetical protein CAOG_06803 [Capsaspora owczarzaki ATCC 30864]|uniref:Phosphatidylethanolamine-binding protein n=1 Tax=Capsaspora owczarzaki (strain ATCC 30864) TaxID=595528 RepID=A0A0D2UN86_CAPO3|nr:hypothetical protein CAOG_06803 [Capsaspora owczarzaki ATCC 30864]KJE96481.1 hypothetical protein CAOG_006803 [Capsaspora owczarzaki ATCC 30864]|eukprot:XP_004344424.2 hypothetical protein CAOG_06803 [Capsaspora owczarzaki ATCC 30864]
MLSAVQQTRSTTSLMLRQAVRTMTTHKPYLDAVRRPQPIAITPDPVDPLNNVPPLDQLPPGSTYMGLYVVLPGLARTRLRKCPIVQTPAFFDRLKREREQVRELRSDPERELRARTGQEIVPFDQPLTQTTWANSISRQLTLTFGIHNRIWTDLAEKVPKLTRYLKVTYPETAIVHGNLVPAGLTSSAPTVTFEPESGKYYTLMMVGLDSNISSANHQYMHWLVADISEAGISSGNTIYPYVQALPLKDTGYHRVAFLLLEHAAPLGMQAESIYNRIDLYARSFSTALFVNEFGVRIVGASFCQTFHDDSVEKAFARENVQLPVVKVTYTPDTSHGKHTRLPHVGPLVPIKDASMRKFDQRTERRLRKK